MLRLVSITGIAIAMVIGFVALSTQMRDDYEMRSRVAEAVSYLRAVAQQELDCNVSESTTSESELQASRPAMLSSVTYEKTESNTMNVVGVFYDTKGISGKLRIKQGRKYTLNCECANDLLQCKNGFTDINKNYVPHLTTPKQ